MADGREIQERLICVRLKPCALRICTSWLGRATRLEGDAGRMVHCVESERAQIGEGLARA